MGHDATFEQHGLVLQKDSEFLEVFNYYRVEQNQLGKVRKSILIAALAEAEYRSFQARCFSQSETKTSANKLVLLLCLINSGSVS